MILEDGHGDANVLAVAFGFEPGVVILAVEVAFVVHVGVAVLIPFRSPAVVGLGLAVLGVEVESVGWERVRFFAVVDVVVEGIDRTLALICNCDASMMLVGHGEEGVHGFAAADGEHGGLPGVIGAETEAEEVAEGSFYTGRSLVVPVDSEDVALEVIGLWTGDGEPDVGDHAGAVDVEDGEGGAGSELAIVGVGTGGLAAGGALESVGLLLGDVGE